MSKSWNWGLWGGFVVALLAPFAYFSLFEKISFAFWISVAAFVIAIALLADGLRRAYVQPKFRIALLAQLLRLGGSVCLGYGTVLNPVLPFPD